MSAETVNANEAGGEQRHRRLDRDVVDMVSALTSRLSSLRGQKPGGSSQLEGESEHGVSIITMAGSNTGATMRSLADDQKSGSHQLAPPAAGEHEEVAPLEWATLVNSNFQAVNNSIMLGTKYKSNDPGVHMEILEEGMEPKGHNHGGWKGKGKKKGRGKGKGKEGSSSSSSSDDETDSEPESPTTAHL